MQARAAAVGQRLAHEGQQQSESVGHLTGQYLEEETVVGGAQGVGVAKGELELGRVVLGVDRLERDLRLLRSLPDRVEQPVGVNAGARPVHVGAGRVDRPPAAVAVGLEDESLELHTDHRVEAQRAPVGHGLAQRGARRHRHQLALALELGHDDPSVGLPARAQLF